MHIVKYHMFNDIDHCISLRTFQAGRIESDVEFVSNVLTAELSKKLPCNITKIFGIVLETTTTTTATTKTTNSYNDKVICADILS